MLDQKIPENLIVIVIVAALSRRSVVKYGEGGGGGGWWSPGVLINHLDGGLRPPQFIKPLHISDQIKRISPFCDMRQRLDVPYPYSFVQNLYSECQTSIAHGRD